MANDYMDLLQALQAMQPTGAQSLASALPFLNLPKKQKRYFQPAYNALDAMMNTDNPLYQKVYGQQEERGKRNLSESIAELQRQNRKASALGRTPLFDPERGGEMLFRGVTRGYQDIQDNAADTTRGILGNAAGGYMLAGQQRSQLAQNQAGIHGNLLGALAKLFKL